MVSLHAAKEPAMCNAMRQYMITTVVCLVGATAVQAQGLSGVPTGTVLTEVMMDVQGTEAQLYGAMLGVPSSPQTLSGTTSTDGSAASFSLSLNPGSTYLGQPISDSVSGAFNPIDGSYDWTGTGSWGGNAWTETGSITPVLLNSSGPTWGLKSTGDVQTLLFNPFLKELDNGTILGTNPTFSTWSMSILDRFGNLQGLASGTDSFDPMTGRYTFQTDFEATLGVVLTPFFEVTSGISPEAGGAGTYTATISALPEPSSWVMGLLGVLGVLGYAWWARKTAGA
jgi:PEP-CTERM motif